MLVVVVWCDVVFLLCSGLHHKKGAPSTSSVGSTGGAGGGAGDALLEEDDGDIEEAMQQGWSSYQGKCHHSSFSRVEV